MKYVLTLTIALLLALAGCSDHAHDGDESHGPEAEDHAHDDEEAHEHGPDAEHEHADGSTPQTQAFYGEEADAMEGHEDENGHEHDADAHSHDGDGDHH